MSAASTAEWFDNFLWNIHAGAEWAGNSLALHYDGSWSIWSSFDTGIFRFVYENNLNSRYAYGTLLLDLAGFVREPQWQDSDFFVRLGMFYTESLDYLSNELIIPVSDAFDISIDSRFTANFAQSSSIPKNLRVQRNHTQLSAGVRFSPLNNFFFFDPYLQLGLGWARFQTDFIEPNSRVAIEPLNTAFSELFAGALLIPQGAVVLDRSTLVIDLAFGLQLYSNPDQIQAYNRMDYCHDSPYATNWLSPVIKVGLSLGTDFSSN